MCAPATCSNCAETYSPVNIDQTQCSRCLCLAHLEAKLLGNTICLVCTKELKDRGSSERGRPARIPPFDLCHRCWRHSETVQLLQLAGTCRRLLDQP